MPRTLTALFLLLAAGLPAQDFGNPEPVWTLSTPVAAPAGALTVTVQVTLPQGYYQDEDSPFLHFEPVGATVLSRSASEPRLRDGKRSFTGSFTLTRTVVPPPGAASLTWNAGWQICRENGACLLPAEKTLVLALPAPARAPGWGFWGALLGAFLGGLLLNLMPCVFPVLALKGVGLAAAAGLTLRERRREAVAFAGGGFAVLATLGVITAGFAVLGQRLDWGFTFQQPLFVWGLVLVFWVFALQLWGVWSWAGSPFSVSMTRRGLVRSFLGGTVLVLAAAPCTAPLLGPALGFAFAQPPLLIPVFFAAVGLGLVLPLLLVQALPSWGRRLPKPGPWTVTVERTAGFFLGATVLYLLWVFTQQTSPDRVWSGLAVLGLVALAFAAAGRFRGALWVKLAAGAVLLGAFATGLASSAPTAVPAPKAGWTEYSPQALESALAQGRPVFVDATAAWCATCQVNEWAVLDTPEAGAAFERLGVVRLRADYTRPNPEVRAWLASVNRAGLPVYALYTPGRPVYLFPELLTKGDFLRALESPGG